ncbi:MAG TPA: XrtA system polysaccharide chain length determinant [Terriglobales bacterium]|nr:XrtA system polysaccharide chain length determinant [Terriglobales bacterium]
MAEEVYDEQPVQIDWKNYWLILRRRRWHLLIPFFVVFLGVWGLSWFMPSVYRSSTLILVEEPSVSKDIVPSSMSTDLQSRLDSLTQQVLSRTRLLRIIDSLNLYAPLRKRRTPDDLVEIMRKDIQIDLVRSPDQNQLSSFTISFLAQNPYVAQQVTTELTNILISENLEVSTSHATKTTEFLESQLEDARKNLAAQEEKVREFKDRHLGALPDQLQSNLQILSGLQSQLQAEQDALGRANQQSAYFESLINQYKTMARSQRSSDGSSGGLPAIEQELQRLRAQLADLSSRYTDRHPDVIKVKDQIAKTEKLKQQLLAQSNSKSSDPNAADDPGATAYGADGRELPMAEVQSQYKANQIEIANRQRSIAGLQERINQYQARLNDTPVAQQELADLTRDYDQSKADYDSLLNKKNQAELTQNLFKQQQGEHFRMIDPPSLPTKPDSPNRFRMALGGLFGGLVLGLGVVAAAEYLDDRLYTEKELKKLLPVEVLVELPPLTTAREERERKRQARLEAVVIGLMFIVTLAGVAFSYRRG